MDLAHACIVRMMELMTDVRCWHAGMARISRLIAAMADLTSDLD